MSYFSINRETSLQEILKQTSLSYATLYTRLKGLTRDGLLLRRRAGWRHLFRLNPGHPVVQKHLELQEVARCSAYLAAHPKQRELLGLLDEAARATPLLTVFLLNGHGPEPTSGPGPLATQSQGGRHPSGSNGANGDNGQAPPAPTTAPAPSAPVPANGDGAAGSPAPAGSASQPPGASLRYTPVPNGHIESPSPATSAAAPGLHACEMVFVVPEPEGARKLERMAPQAASAGIHMRIQTPAEFRALIPYLNGSVPLTGTDFYLRERLQIVYPAGDFAIQAGNGLLAVFTRQPEREFTIQEIQREAKRSYKPTYFGLKKLESWGLLAHRREKWKHYYKLNLVNPVVRKQLELEELRKGRGSLQVYAPPERAAIGELVGKVVKAIPLMAVLHRRSREGPTLYFVVQRRNHHGEVLRPLWAASNIRSLQPRIIEIKSLRSLLARGRNEFGVLYGEEFYLAEKLRTLVQNGNGAKHAPESQPSAGPPAAVPGSERGVHGPH